MKNQKNDRREFIKKIGVLGVSVPLLGSSSLLTDFGANKMKNFGIQLWSIKKDMSNDLLATLTKLSKMGYKYVENFEGEKGLFWGHTNKEFSKILKDLGLNLKTSHFGVKDNFEKKVEQLVEIGLEFVVDPYEGPQKTVDDFKKMAERFNKYGEICKKYGVKFAYHNHDYSFVPIDGVMLQKYLLDNTEKDLVSFEMDVFWVKAAKQDPIKWLNDYPDRFELCHIKDMDKKLKVDNMPVSCILGEGSIDFKKYISASEKTNMKHYIIEQEYYNNSTPMKSAEANFKYLSKLL